MKMKMNKCPCGCHLSANQANEQNCICYSCECDTDKMSKKQNTVFEKPIFSASDDFNLDGTNTAINKNMVWGKIDGHISLTNNKTANRSIWFDELVVRLND